MSLPPSRIARAGADSSRRLRLLAGLPVVLFAMTRVTVALADTATVQPTGNTTPAVPAASATAPVSPTTVTVTGGNQPAGTPNTSTGTSAHVPVSIGATAPANQPAPGATASANHCVDVAAQSSGLNSSAGIFPCSSGSVSPSTSGQPSAGTAATSSPALAGTGLASFLGNSGTGSGSGDGSAAGSAAVGPSGPQFGGSLCGSLAESTSTDAQGQSLSIVQGLCNGALGNGLGSAGGSIGASVERTVVGSIICGITSGGLLVAAGPVSESDGSLCGSSLVNPGHPVGSGSTRGSGSSSLGGAAASQHGQAAGTPHGTVLGESAASQQHPAQIGLPGPGLGISVPCVMGRTAAALPAGDMAIMVLIAFLAGLMVAAICLSVGRRRVQLPAVHETSV